MSPNNLAFLSLALRKSKARDFHAKRSEMIMGSRRRLRRRAIPIQESYTLRMYSASLPLIEGVDKNGHNPSMNFVKLDASKSGDSARSLTYADSSRGS